MEKVEEIFTMQLARAAGKQANRFLRNRRLQKADRDDVIAAAMLWCWENRDNYSLVTTLETWFMNAVRHAYEKMQRDELPTAEESIDEIRGIDSTYEEAAAESSAKALFSALTPIDKEIAIMTMKGYNRQELREEGYSTRAVHAAHRRIKQLRKLLPDKIILPALARTEPATVSDDVDNTLSKIDLELERLEFAPATGAECPPCWRCKWFEGLLPSGKRETRMNVEDPEVREAVKNTEARKIEIAQAVRDGEI